MGLVQRFCARITTTAAADRQAHQIAYQLGKKNPSNKRVL